MLEEDVKSVFRLAFLYRFENEISAVKAKLIQEFAKEVEAKFQSEIQEFADDAFDLMRKKGVIPPTSAEPK